MMIYENKSGKGFVALISVIIISAVLLTIAASLSFSGFYSRYNVSDAEYKEKSLALAEGCADIAMLQWVTDPGNINGVFNATSTVGSGQCFIFPADTSVSGKLTFNTRGYYNSFYSYLQIQITSSTGVVQMWEEKASL